MAINNNIMTEEQFYFQEIQEFLSSKRRKRMVDGDRYYDGVQDILFQDRTAIGEDGKLEKIENVPNNHIIDNQYADMVDQKVNYMFSKPLTIKCEDEEYQKVLNGYFNKTFMLKLQKLGKGAILGGIDYIYPYYDENGNMDFDVFNSFEYNPYWDDSMHTKSHKGFRVFDVEAYEGTEKKVITKAEIFDMDGIHRFDVGDSAILPDMDQPISSYIITQNNDSEDDEITEYSWDRFPVVAFKYNDREMPLLRRIKSLQDGINTMLSTFENNMQDDPRSCIIVLKNYDGQDLGEFRHNLAAYGAVKVRTVDGSDGGVDVLQITVNAENYQAILKQFRDALIKNAKGYDSKDDRLGGAPNEMNIRSMYSDLDLDANGMEAQFQASLEQLIWFINRDIETKTGKNYDSEQVEFIFNRNIMMNTSEDITNCKNSVGILSTKTILSHHPFVEDADEEMEQIDKEKQDNIDSFGFGVTDPNKTDPGNNPDDEEK